jgi:hypothetical protein
MQRKRNRIVVDFKQNRIDNQNQDKKVPALVTFLGFSGDSSCMSDIAADAINSGYRHIEASPKDPEDYSVFRNFFAKVDAYSMRSKSIHIGLGSIRKQAIAVNVNLSKQLFPETPIVLCGHSQGGLIAMEFWRQFSKNYNIKGIITISCPLQGASVLRSLSSRKILEDAAKHSIRRKFFNSKVLPFLVPYLIFPVTKLVGKLLFPSLIDVLPTSAIKNKYIEACNELGKANIPFLNVIAHCPGPDFFYESAFGYAGIKEIIGGGGGRKSDNVLAVDDQSMPISWDAMNEITVEADHGLYRINGYSKVFSHPYTLESITKFYNKLLSV